MTPYPPTLPHIVPLFPLPSVVSFLGHFHRRSRAKPPKYTVLSDLRFPESSRHISTCHIQLDYSTNFLRADTSPRGSSKSIFLIFSHFHSFKCSNKVTNNATQLLTQNMCQHYIYKVTIDSVQCTMRTKNVSKMFLKNLNSK